MDDVACTHAKTERISVCCEAVWREELGDRCARCHDNTGFITVCAECMVEVNER